MMFHSIAGRSSRTAGPGPRAAGVAADAEALEGLGPADAEVAGPRRRDEPTLERAGAPRRQLLHRRRGRVDRRRRRERHHLARALNLERVVEPADLDDPELVARLADVRDLIESRAFRGGVARDVEAEPAPVIADLVVGHGIEVAIDRDDARAGAALGEAVRYVRISLRVPVGVVGDADAVGRAHARAREGILVRRADLRACRDGRERRPS